MIIAVDGGSDACARSPFRLDSESEGGQQLAGHNFSAARVDDVLAAGALAKQRLEERRHAASGWPQSLGNDTGRVRGDS